MMPTLRGLSLVAVAFLLVAVASSQEGKKFSIKTTTNPIPAEVSELIQKLLVSSSIQMLGPDGEPLCEIWFRKEMPTDAAAEQVKTGVTYREVKQTELFGVVQVHKKWSDYRKQPIKPGVYTLRLAYQPTDGKHTADVSEYQDFLLVTAAKSDIKPDRMDPKVLLEASGESIGSGHPGVFMLSPNTKPGKEPELAARGKDWVLNARSNLVVGGKATGAPFGIGLTLVGHSPAE